MPPKFLTDKEMDALESARPPKFISDDEAKTQISKAESFLRGASQGATLGWQDEASPWVERRIGKLLMSKQSYEDTYGQKSNADLAKEYREINKEAKDANPKSYGVGQFAGSIPTVSAISAIPGMGAIGAGGLAGAIQGSGEGETAKDRLLGGAVGGGLGVGLGLAANKAVPALSNLSTKAGRRALGFIQSTIKQAGGKGKVNKAVDALMKEGGVVSSFKSPEGMKKALLEIQDDSGKAISSVLKQLDDKSAPSIDPTEIYSRVANTELRGLKKTIQEVAEDVPEVAKELELLSTRLGKLGQGGDAAATFAEMQYQKQLLGKTINWKEADAAGNIGNVTKKIMYDAINDSIDDALGQVAPRIGNPELATQFLKAKELYGAASTAMKGINHRIAREAGNRAVSLTDFVMAGGMGAGALAAQSPEAIAPAVGVLIAKKLGDKYGWSTVASVTNAARKAIEAPKGLAGKAIEGLSAKAPELGSWLRPAVEMPWKIPATAAGAAFSSTALKRGQRK